MTIGGKIIKARILLNSGAQSNFINETFARKLGFKFKNTNVPITGIHKKVTHINNKYRFGNNVNL